MSIQVGQRYHIWDTHFWVLLRSTCCCSDHHGCWWLKFVLLKHWSNLLAWTLYLATRIMSGHEEEILAKCRWNTDSFGSAKHRRCRSIDSFTKLHDHTGNTSCSTFDVRTKGHQNANIHRQNRLPMEKIGKTSSSLVSDISPFQILRIASMFFTSVRRRTNTGA